MVSQRFGLEIISLIPGFLFQLLKGSFRSSLLFRVDLTWRNLNLNEKPNCESDHFTLWNIYTLMNLKFLIIQSLSLQIVK
ncbi:hypothetical protein VH1807_contig00031-0224 [Vibrio harveyi]|nr:hypothetical protein VH1807_contig00031-0224 [Vibrio harveyi]